MTDAVFLRARSNHARHTTQVSPAHLLLAAPLPHLSVFDRNLLRLVLRASSSRIADVSGLQHVARARDPFILVLNHRTILEALIVPPLLLAARAGYALHFLADWNFRLIPGVGILYKRAKVVNVTCKPAKPRILNILRPLYRQSPTAWERAEQLLRAGTSLAVFPEGRVNRDPQSLLNGRVGAAFLSKRTGVTSCASRVAFSRRPAAV